MDDGGWGKVICDFKPYQICDEHGEYYSVWMDYKQIASFKEKKRAFAYVDDLVFQKKFDNWYNNSRYAAKAVCEKFKKDSGFE